MKRAVLTLTIVFCWAAAGYSDEVALTIYNGNFGLVKQTRSLEFPEGIGEVRFDDVAARIDPTSVHINPRSTGISILEQNYQFDLVSTQKIMQKFLGRGISIVTKGGDLHRGELLSFDGKYVILRTSSGEITISNAEEIVDYRFGSLPEGLILKPTLVWLADSEKKQKSDCEVSYLTDGLNWHAEYVAVVDSDDENLDLSGWVSIDNQSGATYKEASLKLVAGDVHRVQERRPIPVAGGRDFSMAKGAPQFEEEAFFEYHLYTLSRPATVADNEIKQLSLFPETRTTAKKVLTVDKADSKGALQFIGEDLIDHTPKDEKVRVFLGEAFDITCERKKTEVVDLGDNHRRETYEIKLKNHKDEEVVVTVIESTPGSREWHILRSNMDYKKVSAYKVEFPVSVEANGENTLTYTIEY
jgi:hypothetical protein